MQTSFHPAFRIIYVDAYQPIVLEDHGFGKYCHRVASVEQIEDCVDFVGFYRNSQIQISFLYDVVKNASCLKTDAWKNQFVVFQQLIAAIPFGTWSPAVVIIGYSMLMMLGANGLI